MRRTRRAEAGGGRPEPGRAAAPPRRRRVPEPCTTTESFRAWHVGAMLELGPLTAARLAALATGRGDVPSAQEWPWVILLLSAVAFLGTRLLMAFGLTRLESVAVAGLAPLLVFLDAPLGDINPRVALAANAAGCVLPAAVSLKILLERRVPILEGLLLLGIGVVVAYFSSRVVPDKGVLLQYRLPALAVGLAAAGLLYAQPLRAGAAGFMAGALGVVIGADLLNLPALAETGGAGRIILGGAGLLDGIFLVAILAAGVAECTAVILRNLVAARTPTRPTA